MRTASSQTNVNLTGLFHAFPVTVNSTLPYSFAGPGGLVGSSGTTGIPYLTKTNTGSLTLLTSNTFIGGISILNGQVVITNDYSLGTNSGLVTIAGSPTVGVLLGSLQINGSTTNTTPRPIILTSNAVIGVGNNFSARLSGVISGSGTLVKHDLGTLTLGGTNTYAGDTFVNAGTLVVDTGGLVTSGNYSSIGQLAGDNGTMLLKGTGSFKTSGNDFNVGDIDSAVGTLYVQDTATLTVANLFVASGNDAGSTAMGTVNQSGGTVTQTNTAVGEFVIGGRNAATALPVGVYNLSNGVLNAGSSVRVGGNGTGTFNQFGGLFNATNGINLERLGGSGTYNLNGGILSTLNVNTTSNVNTSTFNFNGGTLKAMTNTSSTTFFQGLTGAFVRDGGAVIDTTNFTITIAQPLLQTTNVLDLGTGGLTKIGSGTLNLNGTNTFTGPITNIAGTLSLNTASTYAGALSVNAGTLSATTGSKFNGATTVSNGATFTVLQIGSATNIMSNLTVGVTPATNGATLGVGLSGLNPTTALVNCGTLTFNGTNTISIAGSVPLGTIPLVKYAGAISGSGTFTNLTLPQGVGGFISNSASASTLYVVITNTGPGLVWSGFNTNAALTNLWNISSATNWLLGAALTVLYQQPIIPGDTVTFNDSGSGTVVLSNTVSPASLLISNNNTGYTFRGPGIISGPTGLLKLGTGTAVLNLTGDSYTGDTTVSNGTLQVGTATTLPAAANLVVGPGGILELAGNNQTVNDLSGAGTIDNNSATANSTLTFSSGNWNGTVHDQGLGFGVSLTKVGNATLTVGGTNLLNNINPGMQVDGGTTIITSNALINTGGNEYWVQQNAGTATNIMNGGTLITGSYFVVGRNAANANGTFIMNGGTVKKTGGGVIVVGSLGAIGTLVVNGGQILNNSDLWLGENSTAVAALYLNGGLIQADVVRANGTTPTTSIAYFNGGTLQATAPSASFLQVVQSDGDEQRVGFGRWRKHDQHRRRRACRRGTRSTAVWSRRDLAAFIWTWRTAIPGPRW